MNPDALIVARAAAQTLSSSQLTLLKVRLFGVRLLVRIPEQDKTFVLATHKGKNYFLSDTNGRSLVHGFFGALRNFLAVLGLMSVMLFLGLQAGGFFHHLATKYPGNAVLQFFFGAS